ncbi:MAG: hypothetical protein MI920_25695 [Kiloniellales bacterium]|nr:hypothetical protein [Kiloniellales bacterium]
MKIFRYPPRSLAGDYIRSGTGLAVGVGVLLSVPPSPAIVLIFGGITVLFGLFGMRTLQRHITKVAVTEEEICNAGVVTRILSWTDLERFKLRYYGTKKQHRGEGGFMQLTLGGGGSSLTYESSIEGFRFIAWRAAKALRENGASMDPTSAGNLLAIGLDADGERPPPED